MPGADEHWVTLRWHLAPGSGLNSAPEGRWCAPRVGGYRVTVSAPGPAVLTADTGPVATGFGRTAAAPVLTCRVHAQLPAAGQHELAVRRRAQVRPRTGESPARTVGGAA